MNPLSPHFENCFYVGIPAILLGLSAFLYDGDLGRPCFAVMRVDKSLEGLRCCLMQVRVSFWQQLLLHIL